MPADRRRRLLLAAGLGAVAAVGWPGVASARGLPGMTDGPFYPSLAYRARSLDWDADLTAVRGRDADGQPLPRARGEHLDLHGAVRDAAGRAVDGAEIEIWQCDVFGSYRHPRGAGERIDSGFQGFGATRSDARGGYRFRTIRPAPYPGRTPHIHVKLRHPGLRRGDFAAVRRRRVRQCRRLPLSPPRRRRSPGSRVAAAACAGRRAGALDRRARPRRRQLAGPLPRPAPGARAAHASPVSLPSAASRASRSLRQ